MDVTRNFVNLLKFYYIFEYLMTESVVENQVHLQFLASVFKVDYIFNIFGAKSCLTLL